MLHHWITTRRFRFCTLHMEFQESINGIWMPLKTK